MCSFQEPLNSEDDVSDEEGQELFDTENVVVCQYDKVISTEQNPRIVLSLFFFLSRNNFSVISLWLLSTGRSVKIIMWMVI